MARIIRALVRRAHRPTPAPAPQVTCWLDQVAPGERGFAPVLNERGYWYRDNADTVQFHTNLGRQR